MLDDYMTDYDALVQSLQDRYQRLVDGYPPEQSDYSDGLIAGVRLCLNRVHIWIEEKEEDDGRKDI